MLFILDKSMVVQDTLSNKGETTHITPFFDDEYTSYLETGAETYKFSTLANTRESQHLVVGNHIAFQYEGKHKLFTITEIEETHDEDFIKTVYCEMAGLRLLNSIIRPITFNNTNLKKFLEIVLENTGWSIGKIDLSLTNVCDFEITDYTNAYSMLQEYVRNYYNGELEFSVNISGDTATKQVNVYANRGSYDGFRFSYDSNLTSVVRTVDTSNLATALIGVGKNGITFREVEASDKPLNQDFIADENAYKLWNYNGEHILGYEQFDTESPHELLKLTREKLEERKEPKVKYELKPELLNEIVSIGDIVYVIDNEFNPPIHLSARVSKLTISLTNSENNSCVLANFVEVTSNITDEMRKIAQELEGYVDSQFPISGDKIQNDAISGDKIQETYTSQVIADAVYASLVETEELIANKATIKDLEATNAEIEYLKANKAEIDDLEALHASIDILDANKANIADLNAINANISNLQANKAEINDLKAINADIISLRADKADITQLQAVQGDITFLNSEIGKIGILESDMAEIDNLLAGNITSDNIAAGSITADRLQANTITSGSGIIANGAIGNAQISSLNANKIDTGEIDTSKVKIKGRDGFLFIENNTLYVVDGKRQIRCELGIIENNTNYGLIIRASDGQTIMLDHNGVHNAGITDGAIDNRVVSENANISGKKLDIDSVIRTINEDGSVKIQGTTVQVGNMTLDVKLSEQNNLITEHSETLATHQSEITATKNSIALKVDSQTYSNDKKAQEETFKKHSSSIDILEKSIVNKVESTDIKNALDEYGNVVDTKINSKVSKLEQTDESIRASVSETREKIIDSKNFIINSQALFSAEGYEALGGIISRYEHTEIGDTTVELPSIPEVPKQEVVPPVDIPNEPVVTPPTVEQENTNTEPPKEVTPPITPPVVSTSYSTKIHFINTGKTGDCILIQTDNGKNIMVDSNYTDGADKVVSYLNHLGVKKIDYMIVTHFHTDHAEGFPYIMDRIDVKGANAYYRLPDFTRLPMIETQWKTFECWDAFRLKCNEKGVNRFENLTEKQRITISDTSYIELYNTQYVNYSNYNSLSLVVLFVHGDKRYLLTGDADTNAQANLLGKIGKVDVAKVPHHGYNSTINVSWVKELNPRYWITTRTYGWENAYRDVGMLQVLGYTNYVQYTVGSHIVLTSTGKDFTLDTTRKFLFGNCWCKYDNNNNLWYWFKQGGNIAKNETVVIQGKKYKFDKNGICTNPYNPE